MRALDDLFAALARSPFRRRFKLGPREAAYLQSKGAEAVRAHAADFIATRLAPAVPLNDGKQTPMRGHPVFIAQHATGTCCRSCLQQWHQIAKGRDLSTNEQAYVVNVLAEWLKRQAVPGRMSIQPELPFARQGEA